MNMKKNVLVALVLAGCATTSEIQPYGKGAYIVSASGDSSMLSNTPADMRIHAARAANEFCAKQGKTMMPVESSERAVVGAAGASLVFRCE